MCLFTLMYCSHLRNRNRVTLLLNSWNVSRGNYILPTHPYTISNTHTHTSITPHNDGCGALKINGNTNLMVSINQILCWHNYLKSNFKNYMHRKPQPVTTSPLPTETVATFHKHTCKKYYNPFVTQFRELSEHCKFGYAFSICCTINKFNKQL